MFRGLPTRAMFRQALAESQAWTPIESPWTLPTGLLGWTSLARPAGVAEDELVGGQRDRLADGVGRDALGQRRGGGLGGLLGRRLEDRLAHPLDPGVVAPSACPAACPSSLYWSSSFGSSVRGRSDSGVCCQSRSLLTQ